MNKEKYADLEGWMGIIVNLLLFGLKQWAGMVSGSVAIIADGWHTLSDSLSSVIVVAAAGAGRRPPDREHPYGHGRAETIAAFVIGLLLLLVGFGFIREAYIRFVSREQAHYGSLAVAVTIASIVIKELLARFAFRAAKKSENSSVKADGWHHRSDAISSVIVLTGIIFGRSFVWIDALLAFIVALLILHAAIGILREAAGSLIGEAPDGQLSDNVRAAVRSVLGGEGEFHHLHLHRYGRHREVSFHIRLSADMNLAEGHRIASEIEEEVRRGSGMEATVHLEPASGSGCREVLIPSGNGRIALSIWEAAGERSKGLVVFLAGTMTHPLFYSRFLSTLADGGYTVAGVHTVGHGRSPRSLKRYTFTDMEENCRDAISYVRSNYEGPIILMGSSQGGALASSVAASLPEGEIAALFAHNILLPELPSTLSVTRYPKWLAPFYRLIPVLMRFFARIVPDLRLPIGFYLNPDRIFSDPEVRKAFYNDPEGLISYPLCFLSSLFSADMSALTDGSLKVPVTMIAVTGDPLFSFDYQKEVFGLLKAPEKHLLTIREDVHLILNERVERAAPIILDALDGIV